MKKTLKLFLVMAFFGMTTLAFAQVEKGAKIDFKKDTHDYGDVKYGGDGTCTFVFVNTGNQPLVIVEAKPSCGCTVPDWPREPIAPGEKAEIKVSYDTNRPGAIAKTVTIVSNAVNEPNKVLHIKGNVLPAPVGAPPTNTNGPTN